MDSELTFVFAIQQLDFGNTANRVSLVLWDNCQRDEKTLGAETL